MVAIDPLICIFGWNDTKTNFKTISNLNNINIYIYEYVYIYIILCMYIFLRDKCNDIFQY